MAILESLLSGPSSRSVAENSQKKLRHPKTRQKLPETDQIGPKRAEMDRTGHLAGSLGWGAGGWLSGWGFVVGMRGGVVRKKENHHLWAPKKARISLDGENSMTKSIHAVKMKIHDDKKCSAEGQS